LLKYGLYNCPLTNNSVNCILLLITKPNHSIPMLIHDVYFASIELHQTVTDFITPTRIHNKLNLQNWYAAIPYVIQSVLSLFNVGLSGCKTQHLKGYQQSIDKTNLWCVITATNIYIQHLMQTLKSCHTRAASSQRFYSVQTSCRSPRCVLYSRQQRCEDAVQSNKTPCGGVYFEHAQNKPPRFGVCTAC